MQTFNYNKTAIIFDHLVTYELDGKTFSTSDDRRLVVERETEKVSEYLLKTRLKIKNISNDTVFLKKGIPVISSDISLDSPSSLWHLLIHGKYKNDLPSSCIAGKRDECFADAVGRLSEEGKWANYTTDGEVSFYSDLLTIIKGETECISFLVLSSEKQSTFCKITVDKNGSFRELSLGGEFNCLFKGGEETYTQWYAIDLRPDWKTVTNDFAKERAKDRIYRHPAPSVYSTWYHYGREITADDVKMNLTKIKEKHLPFSCFQIDSGWEKCYGSWEPNEKFSDIKGTASDIRNMGLMAGIWTCPFIVAMDSDVVKAHPEWFLKHTDGTLCIFKVGTRTSYVLDLTNPDVLDWIDALYKKLVSWGYNYHKLDFTRAFPTQRDVCLFNPHMTLVEAYKNAFSVIRNAIGDSSYLEVCGGLYDVLIGIADAQRTGADVRSMWNDPVDESPRIPVTVKQNLMRYFMNEWWDNDPDSLMVRRNTQNRRPSNLDLGLLSDDEAMLFTLNQYAGGGLVCSTEPLDMIDDDRLMLLRHIMPPVKTKVNYTDVFCTGRYPTLVDLTVNDRWHTLCIFNWSEEKKPLELLLDENLCPDFIKSGKQYCVCEFFSGNLIKDAKLGDRINLGKIEPHSVAVIKIAKRSEPQIVCSNMHFSMGGEIDVLAIEENKLKIKFMHIYNYPLHYTVLLPEGYLTAEGSDIIDITSSGAGQIEVSYDLVTEVL